MGSYVYGDLAAEKSSFCGTVQRDSRSVPRSIFRRSAKTTRCAVCRGLGGEVLRIASNKTEFDLQ